MKFFMYLMIIASIIPLGFALKCWECFREWNGRDQYKACLQPEADPDLNNTIFTVETCTKEDPVCMKFREKYQWKGRTYDYTERYCVDRKDYGSINTEYGLKPSIGSCAEKNVTKPNEYKNGTRVNQGRLCVCDYDQCNPEPVLPTVAITPSEPVGDCHLDSNLYMPATRLRDCLVSLGSTGSEQIEYIETAYGENDYLDKVCNATLPGSIYNQVLTEAQADACRSTTKAIMMYPSHCSQGWLGNDCNNGCGNANYAGFYCTGDPCKDNEEWCKYEPNCDKIDVQDACPKLCKICKECKDMESWCKYEPRCDTEDVQKKCPMLCGTCGIN